MSTKPRFNRIGLILKSSSDAAVELAKQVIAWGNDKSLTFFTTPDAQGLSQLATVTNEADFADAIDLLIVLGGDGTLLHAVRLVAQADIPILGVNLGKLGFVTEFAPEELLSELPGILEGKFETGPRMLLECELFRQGQTAETFTILNDVVVNKSALARIIHIEAKINGEFLTRFQSDGLIISTPTGSTAYSLAAGGPIIEPSLASIVLSPICPHTLSHRPLVISDDAELELTLRQANGQVYSTFDGQIGRDLSQDDVLQIRRAPKALQLIRSPHRDYFKVLRSKLKWGSGPNYVD